MNTRLQPGVGWGRDRETVLTVSRVSERTQTVKTVFVYVRSFHPAEAAC